MCYNRTESANSILSETLIRNLDDECFCFSLVEHRDFLLQTETENEIQNIDAVFSEKLLSYLTEGENDQKSRESNFCKTVKNHTISQSYFDIPRIYTAPDLSQEHIARDCEITTNPSSSSLELLQESLNTLKELSMVNDTMISRSKTLKKIASSTKGSKSERKFVPLNPIVGKCTEINYFIENDYLSYFLGFDSM